MELLERHQAGSDASEHPAVPRPAGRLRRLLALAAALAALMAFATLARPETSPSARLSIGEPDGANGDAGERAGRGMGDRKRTNDDLDSDRLLAGPQETLRPLDLSTLADVPANILALGPGEWTWPSEDGSLLAVPDSHGRAAVRILDARTFQPVATVEVDGPLTGFHGFTPGAEAVVVQVGQTLQRHPLDPDGEVTGVDLPPGVESVFVGGQGAMLTDGRVALVVAERSGEKAMLARVLVVDLLAERLVFDLALPALQGDFFYAGRPGATLAYPAFALAREPQRLYVAHADAARVTVVDLAAGTVADAEVGTPVADRGEEPVQRSRWAELSPDGTRLYVAGREYLPGSETSSPMGLSVIDTATMSEVEHMSRVADGLQLSPDGRWLLWAVERFGSASGAVDSTRAGLMDTAYMGLVTLFGDRTAFPVGFSADSSHVYLQSAEAGQTVVTAYALPSLAQTGERSLPGNAWFDPVGGFLRESG